MGNTVNQKLIYNAMMSRETKLTVDGVELSWKLIEGTVKERERKAKKESEKLAKLLEDE